ncbi:MAG TPA: glycoside hydrolase domain-containing protein, partial [Planctomycetota bacterium]|nr:glycoside hydrolase domain-containing protein [Planctomycetota bacterium]
MPRRIAMLTGLVLVGVLLAGGDAAGAPADKTPGKVTVLRTAPGVRFWRQDATLWRYFETWSTDVARTVDGRLVRVDPYGPRVKFDPNEIWVKYRRLEETKVLQYELRETTQLDGSPAPPDGWMLPDFVDADWLRSATFMQSAYRGVAVVCLRGKFEVADPAKVTGLSLDATFQGGAVFTLNGKEIGRAFLPAGKLDRNTLADDYPRDAFVEPSGCLLRQFNSSISLNTMMTPGEYRDAVKDAELQRRYGLRFRRFEAAVPTSMLRRGTNVLAVEVHRAPAHETMFTTVSPREMGFNLIDQRNFWWNRASLEGLTLSADAEPGAVFPNTGPPKDVQLWNWPLWERVDPRLCGEPGQPVRPIRLAGARNGVFAGQVVVSGVKPIRALRTDVTDLTDARGNVLPKSCLRIRYPRQSERRRGSALDALVDAVPDEIPMLHDHYGRPQAAMQPVWLTVDVPADARPGDYAGTLSVRAEGLEATDVPVELHLSDFTLPESADFVTYMGFVQSPDTVAIRYNVPMWSEAHWKLIERSFAVLGKLASKELNIP